MLTLKPLSMAGLAAALEKAERYRLLNEPREAESICLDVLEVDPEHQRALVILLLAITDQFGQRNPEEVGQARALLPRLRDEMSARITPGSSTSARRRRSSRRARRAAPRRRTTGSARRWICLRKPKRSARPATTTCSCAGTPACASSCATSLRRGRRSPVPRSGSDAAPLGAPQRPCACRASGVQRLAGLTGRPEPSRCWREGNDPFPST